MTRAVISRVASVLVLTVVWVVLWGQLDARSITGGLLLGALLVLGLPPQERLQIDALRPLAFLRFVAHYLWLVITSNAVVAWEAVTPGSRIREGIVAAPVVGTSSLVVSVLAHLISGTPGTLIVDIDQGDRNGDDTILYVHVLHLRDPDQVRRDILRLERLIIRAIGSRDDLRQVEAMLAALPPATASRSRR